MTPPTSSTALLLYALVGVVGLIVLIAKFRVNSFVALILASIFVGACAGMKPPEIVKVFQEGVGTVLGSIAVIVGLGTILGKLLAESGGAEVVAKTLVDVFGRKYLPWAVMLIAFIIGLPVFFGVGVVLLIPILFSLIQKHNLPLLSLGIPMVAGLSVAHGLVPPHPGPMVAVETLKADAGKTIFYSILIGLPVAALAGPIFAKWIAPRVPVEIGSMAANLTKQKAVANPPGFLLTLVTILLPVVFMLLATVADVALAKGDRLRQSVDFLGSPMVALLVAVLFAFYSFGARRGYGKEQILKFTEECLGPIAAILLIVGAGGGFNKILVVSGVGDAIAKLATSANLQPLLLGWIVAALIRVATGSATVAITTASGIVAPVVAKLPGTNLELLVISMGAGSLILSHLNDGGFWFVKEYLGLSVAQTLKSWTIMETIISVAALALVLVLDAVLKSIAM